MEIAHEPHWLALLGDSKRVGAYLDAALERAQLVSGGDPAAAPAAFVAIEEPSHLHALFQTEPEAGRPAVVLAYPLPAGGPAVGVDVVAVDPADRGRAAIATADLGGAKLVYFELLHAPGPAEKTGPATVRFAGIALRLRTVARDELDRMGAGPTLAALVPAALAYPDKPSRPDWAAFYAEVAQPGYRSPRARSSSLTWSCWRPRSANWWRPFTPPSTPSTRGSRQPSARW
jgi:hypothetical protein